MLKRFWKRFVEANERIGKARAAAVLTQMGLHNEAKKVMLGQPLN